MENKPASLLVVPLGKTFDGIPHVIVVDSKPQADLHSASTLSRDKRSNSC